MDVHVKMNGQVEMKVIAERGVEVSEQTGLQKEEVMECDICARIHEEIKLCSVRRSLCLTAVCRVVYRATHYLPSSRLLLVGREVVVPVGSGVGVGTGVDSGLGIIPTLVAEVVVLDGRTRGCFTLSVTVIVVEA